MINVDCDKMKDRFVYKAFFKAIARTATDVMALRTAFEAPQRVQSVTDSYPALKLASDESVETKSLHSSWPWASAVELAHV